MLANTFLFSFVISKEQVRTAHANRETEVFGRKFCVCGQVGVLSVVVLIAVRQFRDISAVSA